jgi:dUTP pyrophosphatase
MSLRIKRFDQSLPLPEYKTEGAGGFDLLVRDTVTIAPKSFGYVPLNVAIELPRGHVALLLPRSSLHKRGLIPANGAGVIDEDYCGDADEYIASLYNIQDTPVVLTKGERIMQCVIVPIVYATWNEVNQMGNPNRGRFGTTGV